MSRLSRRPADVLGGLFRSKSIGAGMGFAFSGAAFTLGNLLLAREMPKLEFGRVALALAVYTVVTALGPFGMDQMLLRRRIDPSPALLGRMTLISIAIAAITTWAVALLYTMPVAPAVLLAVAVAAGSVSRTGSMGLRTNGWMLLPLIVAGNSSWAILAVGLVGLALALPTATAPIAVLAASAIIAAAVSWIPLVRRYRIESADQERVPRGEALSLTVVAVAGVLVVQIERFVIPQVLNLSALATYAVIASVAIFPFRLMRSGTSFALVPDLRAASDLAARRALLASEGRALLGMLSLATLVVTLAAPPVAALLTRGRYQLDTLLVLAACFNGAVKLFESLPRSAVTACGTSREIAWLGWMGGLSIAATVIGAWIGARWGLTGLIFGGALASLIGNIPAAQLGRRVVARGYIG
ncbi:hypothetical protein EAH87_14840 [Sphingomonas koreensis]|nr:hypothetical protein EAH87_14840 [Sphingomonas koreensis]